MRDREREKRESKKWKREGLHATEVKKQHTNKPKNTASCFTEGVLAYIFHKGEGGCQ